MAEIEPAGHVNHSGISLPVRAFSIAVPLTLVSGVFLGITGYPAEEWPFVGGVFAASLLLSGALVVWLLIFLGNKLNEYGRLVLAERGVDVDATFAEATVSRAFWVTGSLVFLSLLTGTVWGLGLSVLVFVLEYMSMPPFGGSFPLVAHLMLLVGVFGLTLVLSLQLLLYYSLRHMEQQWVLVSAVARFVFSLRAGNSSVFFWRAIGFSVRSGVG